MDANVPGVLVVDDNDDHQYTLLLLLEGEGYEQMVCASGGDAAVNLLRTQRFSLVLLDMMMPDLNGDEVLRVIKGDPDTRGIPVVMISADTDIEKVSRCIEIGAVTTWPSPSIRQFCPPALVLRCVGRPCAR